MKQLDSRNDHVHRARSDVTSASSAQVRRRALSSLGIVFGAAAMAESFRPSLLPRALGTQIALSALAAVTGYAVGASLGAIARASVGRFADRAATRRILQWVGSAAAVAAGVVAFGSAAGRLQLQARQRADLGLSAEGLSTPLVLLGSIAVAIVLVLLGRALRAGARRLGRLLTARLAWAPRRAALAGGVLLAVLCLGLVVGLVAPLRPFFAARDGRIGAAEHPPASALRSGGPGSLVDWATLGVQGRRFVAGGPSLREIGSVRGSPASAEPIRAYVGLASAPTPAARAELAVDELERTGAFQRAAIVVATPSGTGFVNPVAVDPVELIFGGDVASVALQYSVLPSFLSFALDGPASVDAGRSLLHGVLAKTQALPADQRPAVYVYGESLGAYGSQAAFTGRGVAGLQKVSGALWVGPTEASGFRKELLADATTGPAWEPVVGRGTVVRFANHAAGLRERQAWGPVRAAYLQHPTDPVVWFAPALAWSRPQWLNEPPGPGVPPEMAWRPLVTFEQVLMDLPLASSAAAGYGHDYDADVPLAWLEIIQPEEWADTSTARMLRILDL